MRTTDAVERLDPLGGAVEHEVGAGHGRVGTDERDGGLLGPVAVQAALVDLHDWHGRPAAPRAPGRCGWPGPE